VFNVNLSSISAILWHGQILLEQEIKIWSITL